MYEVIIKILNSEKKYTISELKELKRILIEIKQYDELRVNKIRKWLNG